LFIKKQIEANNMKREKNKGLVRWASLAGPCMDPKDMGQAGWAGLLGPTTLGIFFIFFVSNLV